MPTVPTVVTGVFRAEVPVDLKSEPLNPDDSANGSGVRATQSGLGANGFGVRIQCQLSPLSGLSGKMDHN